MNRHHLIYLQPNDTFSLLDSSLTTSVQQKVQQMIQQNLPFTVCRQDTEAYFKVAANCLVQGQKFRVALGLKCTPQVSQQPPLLSSILDMLDLPIQHTLQQFIQHMQTLSCSVHVYGSYACQYLYQDQFIHAQSDLDLLLELKDMQTLALVIQALAQLKTQLPIRIDGELALLHGQNISFNELLFALDQQQDSIIVKELYAIKLQSLAELFAGSLYAIQQYHHSPRSSTNTTY